MRPLSAVGASGGGQGSNGKEDRKEGSSIASLPAKHGQSQIWTRDADDLREYAPWLAGPGRLQAEWLHGAPHVEKTVLYTWLPTSVGLL